MRIKIIQNLIDIICRKKEHQIPVHVSNLEFTQLDDIAIQKYLEQKPTRKAKGVVYTCITNNYDDINLIKGYKYIDLNWDYVCITDNKNDIKEGQIGIWEIKPLRFEELDDTRNNRWHKTHPQVLFPEYDKSIYIDANINILSPFLFDFINKSNSNIILPEHFKRKCIYDEYKVALKVGIDKKLLIKSELKIIKRDKMPKKYGLCENNVIFRKHNEPEIIEMMEMWWNMISRYSKRDQLSLVYILWKNRINLRDIVFKNTRTLANDFYVFNHRGEREYCKY